MASDLTILLSNLAVNAVDSTRHPTLVARKVAVAPAFALQGGLPGDYLVISPGRKITTWGDHYEDNQQIIVALVKHIGRSPSNSNMATNTTSGFDTVLENLSEALTRERPFNDGVHITGVSTYTTQTGVIALYPVEQREPEWVQEVDIEGRILGRWALVTRLIMEAVILRT